MKRLLIAFITFCTVWTVEGYPVRGVVRSGGDPLAGVVVTDGYGFAVTDARGSFVIDARDQAEFVYIATPSGYQAPVVEGVPQFYRKLKGKKTGRLDFDLIPHAPGGKYALLAVADPQTGTARHMNRFTSETEPDMIELASGYIEEGYSPVGLYLGDIVWDNMSQFKDYRRHMERLGFPVYAVIGNHDYDRHLKGDREASQQFRDNFGPLYYGFNLGDNYFIVLDNIIYDTDKKYTERVDQTQLDWLDGYLEYLPAGSRVYVAMHAPMFDPRKGEIRLGGGESLLSILRGRAGDVTFLTGHAHLNWNYLADETLREHNVGSAGGAWWLDVIGRDGTPNGYKVFELEPDGVRHYFKSTGHDRRHQFVVFDRGSFAGQPNAVGLKVWDIDPEWKVEWRQDGWHMGEMTPFRSVDPQYCAMLQRRRDAVEAQGKEWKLGTYRNPFASDFYVGAVPDPYAREVDIIVTDRHGQRWSETLYLRTVDVQAHRGGMGLMPENTIEAMIAAVELGVNTLELDLQITADRQVVVSHDPYMNYKFVTAPDGSEIERPRMKEYAIWKMTYDSVAMYDTGTRPHPDFPLQKKIATRKPLLSELIDSVERYTALKGYSPVRYNIEIKSSEKREAEGLVPGYREFTDLAMEVLLSKGLGNRLIVQCFDTRTLNYINEAYPNKVKLAYLVDKTQTDFRRNMSRLNFIPDWYSPHHTLVDRESVAEWKDLGMRVVPWTVDEPEDIERMIRCGVDALISNYPDRVLKITRKY